MRLGGFDGAEAADYGAVINSNELFGGYFGSSANRWSFRQGPGQLSVSHAGYGTVSGAANGLPAQRQLVVITFRFSTTTTEIRVNGALHGTSNSVAPSLGTGVNQSFNEARLASGAPPT